MIFHRKNIKYSPLVEAAWYALKGFINPLDSNEKVGSKCYPLNDNQTYAAIKAGEPPQLDDGTRLISSMSKKRLSHHLTLIDNNRDTRFARTYYYRSSYSQSSKRKEGKFFTGYGAHNSVALKQSFSSLFGINHKITTDYNNNMILLGIDFDSHNNEPDVSYLKNWVIYNFFPYTYSEPSTNGNGFHGYTKFKIPCGVPLNIVKIIFTELFEYINIEREKNGIQAQLDVPCGIPSDMHFYTLKEYCRHKDEILKLYSKHTYYIGSESVVFVKRTQCLKIPRFNRTCKTPNINDICSFYFLPFYSFDYAQTLLKELKQRNPDHCTSIEHTDIDSQNIRTPYFSSQKNDGDSNIQPLVADKKEEEKEQVYMCVSPLFGETEVDPDNLHKILKNKSYDDKIKVIKDITDTYKRTITFYFYYASRLGRVPSVSDAVKEYIDKGLNQSSDPFKKERIERFYRAKVELESYFKPEKTELFLDDYDEKEYLSIINDWFTDDTDLTWKKDSNRIKMIAREDLALVLFAIERMNETNEMKS